MLHDARIGRYLFFKTADPVDLYRFLQAELYRYVSIPRSSQPSDISFTGARVRDRKGLRNRELFSIAYRNQWGNKLARVPVTFEDRSFWKPMRRDGGDRWIPRSPWPIPRGSFTVLCPLTGSRIEIPITWMIDAGLRGQKIVDDSATVSNIDVSFTSSHRSRSRGFLAG